MDARAPIPVGVIRRSRRQTRPRPLAVIGRRTECRRRPVGDDARFDGAEQASFQPHPVARVRVGVSLGAMDLGEFEDASGADGAAADDVAGPDRGAPRGAGDHLAERPVQVGQVAAAVARAVDRGGERDVVSAAGRRRREFVGRRQPGPELFAESLPLAGPMLSLISAAWRSRALQSQNSMQPAMWSAASPGVRSAPARPMTAATSSS